MISGKLTVRYTTFYTTGGKFRDQKRGRSVRRIGNLLSISFTAALSPEYFGM